jgi:hypothetical protein
VTWTLGCNGAAEGLAVERPAEGSIRSNFANVYLDPDVSFNYSLTLLDQIIPGTTPAVRWRLDVIDPTQPARARVVFIDRKGKRYLHHRRVPAFPRRDEPGEARLRAL